MKGRSPAIVLLLVLHSCSDAAPMVVNEVCGDGLLSSDEACDDGNEVSGDGCSASCFVDNLDSGADCSIHGVASCASGVCDTTESPHTCEPADVCGNGLLEEGEVCDDGNEVCGDGCSASCFVDSLSLGSDCSANGSASCASGVCDASESPDACEPANDCGNGAVEGDEVCDDGNNAEGDSCDATCTGPSCVVTDTHSTIQQAVDDEACATIVVPPGTFRETIIVGRSVSIRGSGADTIVDADSDGRPFTVDDGTASLSDMTLTGGEADQGGGLYCSSTVVLRNVHIIENTALRDGGGLYAAQGSVVSLERVTIDSNVVVADREAAGGGLYVVGGSATTSDATISNNIAIGADGTSGQRARGGGVFVSGGELVIDSSEIRTNSALGGDGTHATGGAGTASGGGLYLMDTETTITNTTVRANLASGGRSQVGGGFGNAGGILLEGGELILRGSTIDHNQAEGVTGRFRAGEGGGLILRFDTRLTATNCTLSNNRADFGDAFEIGLGSTAAFFNCTIAFNSGADSNSTLLVRHDADVTFLNSVVSNAGGCSGTVVSLGYNLFDEDFDCDVDGDLSGNQVGVDPQLEPLADNGGPTQTHAISETSPALNAGNPAGCVGSDGLTITSDQRGLTRPIGVCDVGAYERQ